MWCVRYYAAVLCIMWVLLEQVYYASGGGEGVEVREGGVCVWTAGANYLTKGEEYHKQRTHGINLTVIFFVDLTRTTLCPGLARGWCVDQHTLVVARPRVRHAVGRGDLLRHRPRSVG